jgi:hypothetical protein
MDNHMLAFFVFITCLLLSRIVNTNAIKKLEMDKKAALVDVFSKNTFLTIGILIAIFAFYFLSINYELFDLFWTNVIYLTALVIYMLVMALYAFRKLKENDFPDFYIRAYILSTTLRFLGLGLFLVLLKL